MRTTTKVLIAIAGLGIAGCGSASQLVSNTMQAPRAAVQRTTTPVRQWTSALNDNDVQMSNLANTGLLISHDLNSGQVRVDRSRWNRMNQSQQQHAARVIQQYQNRNSPRAVTIYVTG